MAEYAKDTSFEECKREGKNQRRGGRKKDESSGVKIKDGGQENERKDNAEKKIRLDRD